MGQRLRAMFCDHLSIMRGKYLPPAKLRDDESRFAQPTFSVHYDKDLLLDAPGTQCLNGIPDMTLRWQGSEIRPGWEADTHVVLGDLYADDGSPLPLCPRGALKRDRRLGRVGADPPDRHRTGGLCLCPATGRHPGAV